MLTNPGDGRVLAVEQQAQPDNNHVKITALQKVTQIHTSVDLVTHNRACVLEPEVRRRGLFPLVEHWGVDFWHGHKHNKKCKCNPHHVRRLKRRMQGLNTSVSEQVFSWFRGYARALNPLRARRHKFMVLRFCVMHNASIDSGRATYLNVCKHVWRKRLSHYTLESTSWTSRWKWKVDTKNTQKGRARGEVPLEIAF